MQTTTALGAGAPDQHLFNSWYNTGEASQVQDVFYSSPGAASTSSTTQLFTYDAAGNRLTESYTGTYHLDFR